MNEKSDAQLLCAFAGRSDEAAFRELVTRHTDFVYSAALRQVESSAIASDLAQSVFTDLAQKAALLAEKFGGDSSLAGWLHRSTRYAALNHLRDTRRRRENERQAMEQLLTNSDSAADWEQIRPALDEALDSLADEDREVLLLRYFKNQDFRAVGRALGVSDDTAQKRVSRAVEKLREFFAKRKITIGAGSLVVLISANAVQAAPAGLATTISAAALLTGTAVTTTTVIAATKTIAMTTLQKTVITAAFVATAGAGMFEAHQATQLREQNQTLQQAQAPLAEQIQQLQRERDDATNRLAGMADEIAKIKSDNLELLKLRGQVGVLQNAAQAAAQIQNDPTVQLARVWKAREAKLRQLFEQRPDQQTPEMQLLDDTQWLSVAKDADLESARGIRLALSRMREVAILNFAASIQQALHTYMNANNKNLPENPSQLAPFFRPPVKNVDAMLARYEMLDKGSQTNEAYHGASIIQKVLIDPAVDNTMIVGSGNVNMVPKPGHAPVDFPRELLPVLKAYMDANNHKTPLAQDELKPYITTPEQQAAFEKFIKTSTE